jgi:hypothetical protein
MINERNGLIRLPTGEDRGFGVVLLQCSIPADRSNPYGDCPMIFAMWTVAAVVAVSTLCFALIQRTERRKAAASRNSTGIADFGSAGGDWAWSSSSFERAGERCASSDSSGDSSGSCDSGGGDGGGSGD